MQSIRMASSAYDSYAAAYCEFLDAERRRETSFYFQLVIPRLLEYAGPVAGLRVLDAGCGEGTVSRILSARARQVVGVDISAPLLGFARSRTDASNVVFVQHDLTKPLSAKTGVFDVAVANLVLNDIADYDAAIGAICTSVQPSGRITVSINNPYSAVVRDKVKHYFDSGVGVVYRGLAAKGVPVTYYHRTMEEYVSAFASRGWLVSGYSDLRPNEEMALLDRELYDRYFHTPYFTVLRFQRRL
jgi:SAM-dependent methyltransferase